MGEKLKNYNQKLLAVLGTMTLVTVLIFLIIGAIGLIREFTRSNRYDANDLIVETDSTGQKLRKQEIAFLMPQIIDSAEQTYYIPVTQVNLDDPEVIIDSDGIFNRSSSTQLKISGSYYRYNMFNNIIVYRQQTGLKKRLFDEKAHVERVQILKINDRNYLLMSASTADTNNDKKLNDDDLQSFYIYDVTEERLMSDSHNSMTLKDYSVLLDSNQIVLQYGIDKNGDGEYDNHSEPARLKLFSISSGESTDFLTGEELEEIQKLID